MAANRSRGNRETEPITSTDRIRAAWVFVGTRWVLQIDHPLYSVREYHWPHARLDRTSKHAKFLVCLAQLPVLGRSQVIFQNSDRLRRAIRA